MSGSFVYAPYVPLQANTIMSAGEDRCGQIWGDGAQELLVVESTLVHATGSFWSHQAVDLLTEAGKTYSEYKLTSRFKRRC